MYNFAHGVVYFDSFKLLLYFSSIMVTIRFFEGGTHEISLF